MDAGGHAAPLVRCGSLRVDAEGGRASLRRGSRAGPVVLRAAGAPADAGDLPLVGDRGPRRAPATRSASASASSTSWVTSRTASEWRSPQLDRPAVHLDPGQRVQRAERLVEQQQVGLADQRPGQRDPLGLAAGQRQRPGVALLGEADLRRASRRPARARLRARAALSSASATLSRDPRHGSSRGSWKATDVRPVDLDLAGGRRVEAGQAAQQRGLAASRCGRAGRRTRRARMSRSTLAQHVGARRRSGVWPRDAGRRRRRRCSAGGGLGLRVRSAMPAPSSRGSGRGRR